MIHFFRNVSILTPGVQGQLWNADPRAPVWGVRYQIRRNEVVPIIATTDVRIKSRGRTGRTWGNRLENRFQHRQTVNPTTFRHTRLREWISKKYTKGFDNITESNQLGRGEQYGRKRLTKNTIPNPDLVGARSCIVAHLNIECRQNE
jgi:hypothetical protein